MSISSKIEWTESTWNPVTGCTPVSAGCQHCYAATLAKRLKAMGNPRYTNGFQVTQHLDLFDLPLKWKKPKMVFVNSMSDLFHNDIPDEAIISIFETMNKANWHTFQVLTKRTDRLVNLASRLKWTPNIWMGVTIENRATIYRCEALKSTNAAIKFISAEPLLESIVNIDLDGIDWLIVGGESGPGCRFLDQKWVEELHSLTFKTGTAFFFKQWGGFPKSHKDTLLNGVAYKEYPLIYHNNDHNNHDNTPHNTVSSNHNSKAVKPTK